MFTLTLNFGPQCKEWKFVFKTRSAAETFHTLVKSAKDGGAIHKTIQIQDEFGQDASLEVAQIHAHTVEDLDQQAEANNQFYLAHARGQARLEQAVQDDPDPALKKMIQRQRHQQMLASVQGGARPGPFQQ